MRAAGGSGCGASSSSMLPVSDAVSWSDGPSELSDGSTCFLFFVGGGTLLDSEDESEDESDDEENMVLADSTEPGMGD